MKVPNNNCGLRLRKGLYWLKQSPRIWNNQFKSTIERYGFKATISDSCIFFNEDKNILMAIYADDGLIFAKRQHEIEEVFSMLRENFDIRETTGSCFIGTKIDKMTRKSISGTLIILSGPIIFRSSQQPVVARSTTEAEFIAASDTVQELIWLQSLLGEIGIATEGCVKCDSQTAIRLIKNPELQRRTKHIDIR